MAPGPPLSVGRAPADYLRAILTARADTIAAERGLVFVHPFETPT